MADEPKPVELVAPVPAAPEPVAPSAPAAPAPAEPAAPAPAPAAPAAPAPAPTEPAAPAIEPGLLEQFDADKAAKEAAKTKEPEKAKEPSKEAAKPTDKPVEKAEEKPAEASKEAAKTEPAAPEPVAYEYALPETLKMDEAVKASFHEALDGFRADPAKGAQKLIDLHNQAMVDYDKSLRTQIRDEQIKAFNETRKGWRTQVMADEQIGGSGYQTSMGAIARMRDMLVPESDRASFEEFLKYTGAGDHPAFLRLLHNAARYFDEPGIAPPNPQPTKDAGRPPNRRATLYDNPRSPNNRQ